ncbi:hypothetical protein [Streptomyces sp. SD31]|uniref:hypothetical protein n=1 Tax=Streptomyces sp. SD31 TaxID=3452208 RepID=UPI003F88F67F
MARAAGADYRRKPWAGLLLREALAGLCERPVRGGGQADDGAGLLELVGAERPDLAIADARMPTGHSSEGLKAARTLRR